MKHSAMWFAMVMAAGCVDMEEPELASDEAFIVDGSSRAPDSMGVALVSKSCTATMVSNDIALTTGPCGIAGGTVAVGTSTAKIRNVRVPRRSNGNDAAVVAVQLTKPLTLAAAGGASTSGFSRAIDPKPVKQGESIICMGYSKETATTFGLRSAVFDVIDGSTDTLYRLRSRQAGGVTPSISTSDLGGFCARDGGGIVAILSEETGLGDIGKAIAVHDLAGGMVDMEVAREASRNGVAVRLRDDKAQRFITARPNLDQVIATATASTDPGQRDQAFYLDKITNPFAQGTWNRLVDARSGRCLTSVNGVLAQRRCNTTNRDQMFFVQATQVNGFDRYIVYGTGGQADADGSPSVAMRTNTPALGSQQFEMWLTLF